MILAGIIALLVAMAAGVAVVQQALAHHSEYYKSGTCEGWTADAGYVGGSSVRLVIIERVVIGGQNYQTGWSTGFNTGSGTSGGILAYGGGTIGGRTLPTSGAGQITDNTNVFYWYGIDNSADPGRPTGRGYHWTLFNRNGGWPAGAFSGRVLMYSQGSSNTWTYQSSESLTSFSAPTRPSDCERKVHVKKVVTGTGASTSQEFAYTIAPAAVNDTVSQSNADTHELPKNIAQTVVESTPLPTGYNFVRYAVRSGNRTCPSTPDSDWTVTTDRAAGAAIPGNTSEYTVCIYNNYQPTNIVLSGSACEFVGGVANAYFHFIIPAGTPQNAPNGHPITVGFTGNVTGAGNQNANERSPQNPATVHWDVYIPFGANGSITANTAQSTGYNAIWNGVNGAEHKTVSSTACQPQVVLPEVKKVAVDPPNNLSGGYAFWDIVITPAGANSPAFDNLQIVDFYNIAIHSQNPANACTVLGDGKTLECDVPAGASPVTVRVKRAVSEAVQNQCLGGEISNKLVSASYNQQPITITQGTSDITYTIPGIPSACDKPGITKTTQTTSTTNPNDVSWTVQVTNPASGTGTQQTVWIKDSNVVVVSGPTFTGGANCDPNSTNPNFQTQLNDSDGVQCSMPNNSTITFQVKPAGTIARTCADQKFNNTAEIYVGSTAAPPASAVGPEITLTGNPALCDRTIKVCKVMVGNGDLIDNGGTFKFTVSGIAQPIELTVVEPATNGAFGTRVCSDPITVPAGEVTVTETADRPADWPGDHPAAPVPYPSYHRSTAAYPGVVGDWTGGSSVTFTPNTDASKNTITFKNRAKPTRELEICKVVAGNGDGAVDGGVFKFDITGIDAIELVAYEPAGDATNGTNGTEVCKTVRVANTAVTVTEWEARPPTYGWEGSWNGDDPLFPQNSVFGLGNKNGTANVPANVNKVTFYNKTNPRDREIIIEKFFLNLGNYQLAPGDWPTFVPVPAIEGWTFAANCTELLNGIDPNHRAWSCKVPASWTGDFEEELDEDRWEQVECDFPEAQRIAEVFTFCNTPITRVTVIKQFVGDFNGETFTFSNTNLPGPVANAPGGNSNQVQVFDSLVEPDSFSVTENEFLTQSEGCFGDEAEGYHTVYSIVKNGVTIATQVEGDTANFTAGPGDEVVVTFINARCGILSSPQIVIQKFNDPAGNRTGTNGLAGFQFRVFNNGVELPGSPFVLGAGPLPIPGLNPGTVEVYELDPNTGGWVLTGSKTDLGDNGSFEFEVGGQPAARNIDFGEIIRFNFYNQPRVNITVSKTIFNNANPQGANGGAGWTFTLSGCGVGPDQQTTGASGSVSWTNLPPAVNCTYTVTETAKAGWVADQISYNTSPNQLGQTANLTFVNRQLEGCVNINDCPPPTSTPTSTPTTPPTSTPVPGETPTTPPDETPAASPSPEETVAGEQTPGPGQPTPIAPSTGAGFGIGGAAGFNLLLVIAGLIAISGGFSFIALGRRSATRR